MKLNSKTFILTVLLLVFTTKAAASDVEYIHPFKLNPLNDSLQLSSGALLAGSVFFCDKFGSFKDETFDPSELKQSRISLMDQFFMRPYSKPLDYIGTGVEFSVLLSPLVLVQVPKNEWVILGTMYVETMLFTFGITEWTKLLVDRARPYMYFDEYPEKKVDNGDWNCSFPSGHTARSFAAAAFTSYAFCQYYPDSKWRYAVIGISFGAATTTAMLRMASGNHFFTDVLVGAMIGTTCGFLVPYMHTTDFYKKFERKGKQIDVNLSPVSFNVTVKF